MTRSKKLPAMHFYPGDWRKEPSVQALDYEARGVWFETLLIMHESSERGVLLLNGRAMTADEHARILGLLPICLNAILDRIIASGAASRREDGALVCRRMVREDKLSHIRAEAGSEGGKAKNAKQNPSKRSSKTLANAEDEVEVENEVENEVEDPDLDPKKDGRTFTPTGKFDTPKIRKFLPLVQQKLASVGRGFGEIEFEAWCVKLNGSVERMEQALIHTATLTKPFNLNEPSATARAGPPGKKLSGHDQALELLKKIQSEDANEARGTFEIDGSDRVGIPAAVRRIGGTP